MKLYFDNYVTKIYAVIVFLLFFTLPGFAQDTVISIGPRMVVVTLETDLSKITKVTLKKDVVTSVTASNGDITNTTTRFTIITTTTPKYTKISNLVTYQRADKTTYANVVVASIATEPFVTTSTNKAVVVSVVVVKAPINIPYTDTDANLGIKTIGYNSNSNFYKTNEFLNTNSLSLINADKAYARGWTGKGVTVAIADTGYDLNNSDFKGQVIASKDYTGTSIQDTNGHGTFTLGQILALKNDIGTQGVAYDSKAVVLKVGTGSSISISNAIQGFSWAADQGATISNLSANSNYDNTFIKNLVKLNDGIYRSVDTRYDYSKNIFYNGQNPSDWQVVTNKGMIVVNSAGNQGLSVPANPGTFATAVDSSGNLILGGKMLIVGAVDSQGYMYSWSNKAGSICQQFNSISNTCLDKYKISDFYLVAPGTATGLNLNNSLTIMSGTSMAAPLVTGGLAVLQQMWPYMKSENLVQLALKTANKNIPNYNVSIQGQGLFDLDKATQPYGVIGIPTSGKTTATAKTASITNVVGSGAGLSSITTTQALSNVMVVDEFARDYYVNLQSGTATGFNVIYKDNRKISDVKAQQNNSIYLPFNQAFGVFEQNKEADIITGMKFGLAANPNLKGDLSSYIVNEFKVSESINLRTTLGTLNEKNTWLGNESAGVFSVGNNNLTAFNQIGFDIYESVNKFSFDIGRGFTKIKRSNDSNGSFIKDMSTLQSQSYKLGYERNLTEFSKAGLTYSLPSYIVKGHSYLAVPYATDQDGNIIYADSKVNLKAKTPEKNIGLYYTSLTGEDDKDWVIKYNTEYRTNIAGQSGKNGFEFGTRVERNF
jgi:subtilisin family serine protease